MKKYIDGEVLATLFLLIIFIFMMIFLFIFGDYREKREYNDPKKFEYSKYYRETLYEHICNYSNTLRIEIDNGDSNIFGVSRGIYRSKKSNMFNVYVHPVVRPRWYSEQLMNRGSSSGNISSSTELKVYLYIDENIFFLLKSDKVKKLIKDRELLNKDFICRIDFYKKYIEDSTYYSDKILYYLENKDEIISRLYDNFGFYSDDSIDNKIRALNKYRNNMWNIIVYERE